MTAKALLGTGSLHPVCTETGRAEKEVRQAEGAVHIDTAGHMDLSADSLTAVHAGDSRAEKESSAPHNPTGPAEPSDSDRWHWCLHLHSLLLQLPDNISA